MSSKSIPEVKERKRKLSPQEKFTQVLKYLVLAFTAFITLVPLVVVVFGAFKRLPGILYPQVSGRLLQE